MKIPTFFLLIISSILISCTSNQELPEERNAFMVNLLDQQHEKVNPLETTYYFNKKRAHSYDSIRNAPNIRDDEYISYTYWFIRETLNSGDTESTLAILENLNEELKGIQLNTQWKYYFDRLQAIAYIRLGEQTNCLLNHTALSCVVPVSDQGTHIDPQGSKRAIELLEELLKDYPKDLELVWLLNICYQTIGQYPESVPNEYLIPPSSFYNNQNVGRFEDYAPKLGVDVSGISGGSILEDFNNDGLLDLVVTSSGFLKDDQMRIFINEGDGTFSDQTKAAGLEGLVGGLNCQQTDFNNDGFMDIFVLRGGWFEIWGQHPNSLLRNNGDGTFTDVTKESGLLTLSPTQTAAWADFNNDGWLDVFIGNESTANLGGQKSSDKRRIHRAELYINQKDGTFENVAPEKGLDFIDLIKGVVAFDFNNDNLTDIYLSNNQGENRLLQNKGNLEFEDITIQAGVSEPIASFPVGALDYNNDGLEDLLVCGYISSSLPLSHEIAHELLGNKSNAALPKLYENNGDGTFTDVTELRGLDKSIFGMGFNYGDLNNDGYLDLYFGTGDPNFESIIPNRMFLNINGEHFEEVSFSGGFSNIQKGHGISWGDIDNDGDEDIYITMGGAHEGDIYQNQLLINPTSNKNWINISLKGKTSNKAAIGTKVHLVTSTQKHIHRVVSQGASFGANSFRLEIGLEKAEVIEKLEINWPSSGITQRFENIRANQFILIEELQKEYKILEHGPINLEPNQFINHRAQH